MTATVNKAEFDFLDLFTGGKDGTIGIISNGQLVHQIKGHGCEINKVQHISDNALIASGDDNGLIEIWDLRVASKNSNDLCVMTIKDHEGTISDMAYNANKNMLLATSNDGHLGVFDLRKSKDPLYAMSDNFEEDLNAICLLKDNKKVAVSTVTGSINIFTWDWFGDCNDRITGHPSSVDCMIQLDENTLITGCDDGLVRAVSVHPTKILCMVGDSLEDELEDLVPIQALSLSHDKKFVAASTHDDMVKIFDVTDLHDRKIDDYESDPEEMKDTVGGIGENSKNEENEDDMDWEQIQHKYEEEDDSSSEEEEVSKRSQRKKHRVKGSDSLNIMGNVTEGKQRIQMQKAKAKEFFKGL